MPVTQDPLYSITQYIILRVLYKIGPQPNVFHGKPIFAAYLYFGIPQKGKILYTWPCMCGAKTY